MTAARIGAVEPDGESPGNPASLPRLRGRVCPKRTGVVSLEAIETYPNSRVLNHAFR